VIGVKTAWGIVWKGRTITSTFQEPNLLTRDLKYTVKISDIYWPYYEDAPNSGITH